MTDARRIVSLSTVAAPRRAASRFRQALWLSAAAIALALLPFAAGMVGSVILATLLTPVYRRISTRIGAHAAAAAITLGVLTLLILPGVALTSTVVTEARRALAPGDVSAALSNLTSLRIASFDFSNSISDVVTGLAGWLSARAAAVVGTVTSAVLNVVIALLGLYYLLVDGETVWLRLRHLVPADDTLADALAARFVAVTNALLLGTLLTAAVQGTLIGVAFAAAGLRPAILWGFVTGCVAILPLFGSALVWAPGTLVLASQHRTGAALALAIFGVVFVSNIDNVLRPLVYRRVSGIHPMVTIVGALAGVKLLGLVGALVGPLALSYFNELLGIYERLQGEDGA